MRVLIAPDAFKESLTPTEAADAIAHGVRRAADAKRMAVEIDLCPIADGGEGFIEAIVANRPCQVMEARVVGPLGARVPTPWALLREDDEPSATNAALRAAGKAIVFGLLGVVGDQHDAERRPGAAIESAGACGLSLVPFEDRDPERATSAGLGELISEAVDHGCGRIIIGLGGSATVDGGVGCLHALGARFRDDADRVIGDAATPPTGADLGRVHNVDLSALDPRLSDVEFLCACDVNNPLIGDEGAARIYGPQKGATPAQVERLDAGLERLVACAKRAGLRPKPDASGAGAAGGLGFALATFLGATLAPGAELLLAGVGFESRCLEADLVITGEGSIDAQSARGKAAWAAGRLAEALGRDVIAMGGRVTPEARLLTREHGGPFHSIWAAAPDRMARDEALARAAELLAEASGLAFNAWLRDRR
ncbi:MAG: glycerate kinase [Phycisphaerales bacterium]